MKPSSVEEAVEYAVSYERSFFKERTDQTKSYKMNNDKWKKKKDSKDIRSIECNICHRKGHYVEIRIKK